MLFYTIAALALATLSHAEDDKTGKRTIAKFDNLNGNPAFPQLNQISNYKGLHYIAFEVADVTLGLLGIEATSPPNVIVSGTDALLKGVIPGFSINSTKTKNFDLHSFTFGCVLDLQNGAAAVPQTCTIAVQCYDGLHSQTASAVKITTFHKPATDVKAKPFLARFQNKCLGVQKVLIKLVSATGGMATNALVVDNVDYTLH